MDKKKTSDAQLKAVKKWKNKNKELQKKYVLKSNCKRYLEEIEEVIKKAKKDLTI